MTTSPVVTITDEFLLEISDYYSSTSAIEMLSKEGCLLVAEMAKDLRSLRKERAELKRDAERFREIVCAVVREIPHRNMSRGNAPGHCHSIAGVWDEDNGDLAGTECAWCKVWHAASEAAMQERQE